MSWYTTTGVTVSAAKAEDFLALIRGHEDFGHPSQAVRHPDGAVSVVYGWQNHFPCDDLRRMLEEKVGMYGYCMTVADEGNEIQHYGCGDIYHETEISISIWVSGEDIDMGTEAEE